MSNAALEREGIPLAVTHLSLRSQGLDRDPARYANPHNRQEVALVQDYRTRLHQGEKPFEQELYRAAWAQQKQREGIYTLDRQAVLEHVRDHTFRYDRSPRRELERQQSFAHSLARSYTPLEPHRVVARIPTRQLGRQLERLVGTRDAGRDESVGGATFRPRLREEDQGT